MGTPSYTSVCLAVRRSVSTNDLNATPAKLFPYPLCEAACANSAPHQPPVVPFHERYYKPALELIRLSEAAATVVSVPSPIPCNATFNNVKIQSLRNCGPYFQVSTFPTEVLNQAASVVCLLTWSLGKFIGFHSLLYRVVTFS